MKKAYIAYPTTAGRQRLQDFLESLGFTEFDCSDNPCRLWGHLWSELLPGRREEPILVLSVIKRERNSLGETLDGLELLQKIREAEAEAEMSSQKKSLVIWLSEEDVIDQDLAVAAKQLAVDWIILQPLQHWGYARDKIRTIVSSGPN
jgi:hypothetical protein